VIRSASSDQTNKYYGNDPPEIRGHLHPAQPFAGLLPQLLLAVVHRLCRVQPPAVVVHQLLPFRVDPEENRSGPKFGYPGIRRTWRPAGSTRGWRFQPSDWPQTHFLINRNSPPELPSSREPERTEQIQIICTHDSLVFVSLCGFGNSRRGSAGWLTPPDAAQKNLNSLLPDSLSNQTSNILHQASSL
jgi:hypothetical protein